MGKSEKVQAEGRVLETDGSAVSITANRSDSIPHKTSLKHSRILTNTFGWYLKTI